MLSTHQTLTVLSTLSLGAPPHPRQTVTSLLLWGGGLELEAGRPRGGGAGRAQQGHTRSGS